MNRVGQRPLGVLASPPLAVWLTAPGPFFLPRAPESTLAAVGRGASSEKGISGVKTTEMLYREGETGTLRARAQRGESEVVIGYRW